MELNEIKSIEIGDDVTINTPFGDELECKVIEKNESFLKLEHNGYTYDYYFGLTVSIKIIKISKKQAIQGEKKMSQTEFLQDLFDTVHEATRRARKADAFHKIMFKNKIENQHANEIIEEIEKEISLLKLSLEKMKTKNIG